MKLNEIGNLSIWSVMRNKFITLSECDCTIDDMFYSTDYVFLRNTGKVDKAGVQVKEGDILRINPDDDSWEDIVVYRYSVDDKKGERQKRLELLKFRDPSGQVGLALSLDENNPALVIGNILTHPHLAMMAITLQD